MVMLIEIDTKRIVNGFPTIVVNGQGPKNQRLRILPDPSAPFTRVILDEDPQYDVQIWIDGSIRHVIPKKSEWSESIYEMLKAPQIEQKRNSKIPEHETVNELREKVLGQMALVLKDANFDQWQTVRRMNAVWLRNGIALVSLLDKLATDHDLAFEMVQNVRPTEVRDSIALQLDQHIFNYLSSMKSMIAVTRTLSDEYEGSEFWKCYNSRKTVIASDVSFRFVSDLRNYNLHYALPIGGHTVSFNGSEEDFKSIVTASRDQLLKWKNWSRDGRKFLLGSPESIDLTGLFKNHFASFLTYWQWILDQAAGLHGLQIFVHDELVREGNWLLTLGALESPRREWLIPPEYQSSLEGWYET